VRKRSGETASSRLLRRSFSPEATLLRRWTRSLQIIVGDRPGLEMVQMMMSSYADVVINNPQRFRIAAMRMAVGFSTVDMQMPSFVDHHGHIIKIIAAFVAAIERGQGDGSVRRDLVAAESAPRLWAGLLGVLLMRINLAEVGRRVPESIDVERFVPGYVELVCDGLRPSRSRITEKRP
jgi:hypothetical protein